MLGLILLAGLGCFFVERLWPANALPRVRAWWGRILLVNITQLGMVLCAGVSWDLWFQKFSVFKIQPALNDWAAGFAAYLISTLVYYGWHRVRHESRFFWLLCHQLHHSPRRIEILTSFYKHPVEIFFNAILSSAIVYGLLGCSIHAAAVYLLVTALAEYFYHWNIRTPTWLGHVIQRPESHRIHHQYQHHTHNYGDLPVWDKLFGTFRNADQTPVTCGFDSWREDRFTDMLVFRDVHNTSTEPKKSLSALHLLPTCMGCSKRWACAAVRGVIVPEPGLAHKATLVRPQIKGGRI
jgi:sterol desaturase/sphingolipid hydroxylase (fatty acid hydroxylase superfamily)